jgi:cytochrome P450
MKRASLSGLELFVNIKSDVETKAISMTELAIPAHVPAHLVRDFDLYGFEGASANVSLAWKAVQDNNPPIFFTPRYGGYWVFTRAERLEAAWPDWELYSSADSVAIPPIPKENPPLLPIDADDPFHKFLRKPLNIALSPKAVNALQPMARALAIELIEQLIPRGECDFVNEFSLIMPMEIFLRLVNLPSEDRPYLIGLVHQVTKTANAQAAMSEMYAYLDSWVRKRGENPGDDLLSQIVNLDAGGRPLTHHERVGYASQVMFGGLDTVGGMMAMAMKHLAEHPADRQRLVENPTDIPMAIEEFLRRYAIPKVGRHLTRDVVIDGVEMKKGDGVMLVTVLHGLDERRWPDPLDVRIDRCPRDHMAFGVGTHRCPGANLARAELRIVLEEWLKRIPDFAIADGADVVYIAGAVDGLQSLPITWPVS